ncbi:RHS repeat-associated core domain-containing protein [Pseudomonas aeruginosa]|nr:RHS repeat-associated core domain-containing protein [Pseudomonas putida]
MDDFLREPEIDMRFFYQGAHQHSCIEKTTARTAFRQGEQLLALQQSGLLPRTSLMPTDVANSVFEHERRAIAYSPYGHDGLKNPIHFGFKGEYRDTLTGNYLLGNGYRLYNPVIMRFQSPDHDAPFDRGGINAYTYVLGDPINLRDPSGHRPIGIGKIAFSYEGWAARLDDLAVFWTSDLSSPTGLVLNIYGHGAPGKIQMSRGNLISGTKMLAALNDELGIDASQQPIHLISCYSANRPHGGGLSMMEQLMNKTQSSVTGYQGPVHVREVYTPDRYAIEIVESNTFKPGSENHKKFLYHPVTISPGNTEALALHPRDNYSLSNNIRRL